MIGWIKNLFARDSHTSSDKILKYPNGKRYYVDFHNIRKSHIDPDAQKVIGRLGQFGYKAYVVGGCVRDLLLGRQPKDYDIVTNATPNDVKRLFTNSRLIGRRFRIVHVVFKGGKVIEVSTARSLPQTRNTAKTHDDLLLKRDNEFGTFKDDAARRDFTINSLFFDVRNESIIDYTGGFEDIKNGIIRIIGDENISLPEDPVRMLRAVKFAGTLGFKIDSSLDKGIHRHKRLISNASSPRLHEEYNKIFRTGNTFEIFKRMVETGLFESIFPHVAKGCPELQESSESFSESLLGKALAIGDRMIQEHEDINTLIYYALIGSGYVKDLFNQDVRDRKVEKQVKSRVDAIQGELGLSKKEAERIFQIYNAQRQFYKDQSDNPGWVKAFKNKPYFLEAFTLYKVIVRAEEDDEGIQRALFWEIGLRKKLPFAIRKNVPRPLASYGAGGGGGRREGGRDRRPPRGRREVRSKQAE